jgi:hypothetical protein
MESCEPQGEASPVTATYRFMRSGAISILGLSLIWLLLTGGGGRAQESPPTEYQLKAAFLFNFAKFVEWPPARFAETNSRIVLGILGKNPFGDILQQTIKGKTINNHSLEVVTYFDSSVVLTNCHILFISDSEKDRLKAIIDGLSNASVLTVGETDGFIKSGGMIRFFPLEQENKEVTKIRFEINEQAARDARLKISSKLLILASPKKR